MERLGSHFHGVVLICDLTGRLLRGPHIVAGRIRIFCIKSDRGIRGYDQEVTMDPDRRCLDCLEVIVILGDGSE
jgi:hypothetical protein